MPIIRTLASILMFIFFCSCESPMGLRHRSSVSVVLPSMTHDFDFTRTLTYSALIVMNDTSAHLFTLGDDLLIKGELAKRYETYDNWTRYRIFLDSSYRSYRGESINSRDVVYSAKLLSARSQFVRAAFESVGGANNCDKQKCQLSAEAIDDNTVEFKLKQPDPEFIEKLASPFLVIIKDGSEPLETVGTCRVPYQTGIALLKKCTADMQQIEFADGTVNIFTSEGNALSNHTTGRIGKLLTTNPGKTPFPSLIVLSLYALPQSQLSRNQRIEIMRALMSHRNDLATALRLKPSSTFVSEWFKLRERQFPGINVFDTKRRLTICPQKPLRIALESTLPDLESLQSWLRESLQCQLDLRIVRTDQYFDEFYKADIAFLWVTPDYLDYYNIYSIFDCPAPNCYINWHDMQLQRLLKNLKDYRTPAESKETTAEQIERHLMSNGYVAPLVQMNSWIDIGGKIKPVHPAGLAQLRARDFLYE